MTFNFEVTKSEKTSSSPGYIDQLLTKYIAGLLPEHLSKGKYLKSFLWRSKAHKTHWTKLCYRKVFICASDNALRKVIFE